MAHSILPHNHLEEDHISCRIVEPENFSLLDLIKITLSHDIGDNHLKEYQTCNDLENTSISKQYSSPSYASKGFHISHILSANKLFSKTTNDASIQYYNYCSGLRAPPYSFL